jgi:hypothetical protein
MGTVIYSASPMQAFLAAAGTILFIFGLGIAGIAAAILQRKKARGTRLAMGAAGGILLVAGLVYAALTLTSAASPTQSVALNLDKKSIAEDNCGDNGETCKRYVLEATTNTTAYDFNVPQQAYEKAQVNTCYQFTYYANKGLLDNSSASYQEINNVARIETADPSICQ